MKLAVMLGGVTALMFTGVGGFLAVDGFTCHCNLGEGVARLLEGAVLLLLGMLMGGGTLLPHVAQRHRGS
ncbi:MAG TPA: hypothetical protein VEZ14_02935 [Dehalococcoidia bacterium]|nr:hypothetical protein [Dehalococcoidia bacterium]